MIGKQTFRTKFRCNWRTVVSDIIEIYTAVYDGVEKEFLSPRKAWNWFHNGDPNDNSRPRR